MQGLSEQIEVRRTSPMLQVTTAEIFNLFNRANFDLPNRIFGNANFGRIFSAKNPREMQFGLRLSF